MSEQSFNNSVQKYRIILDAEAVKVFDKDVVVAAGVHFGKGNLPPLAPHVVAVHKLGVLKAVTAFQDRRQRVRGIQ